MHVAVHSTATVTASADALVDDDDRDSATGSVLEKSVDYAGSTRFSVIV